MKQEIVMISAEELSKHNEQLVRDVVKETVKELERVKSKDNLYCINQVAKKLGKNYHTVKRLVEKNIIRTTASGHVSQEALDEYLINNK